MNCAEFRESIVATPGTMVRLQALIHRMTCRPCRVARADVGLIREALSELPARRLPSSAERRIQAVPVEGLEAGAPTGEPGTSPLSRAGTPWREAATAGAVLLVLSVLLYPAVGVLRQNREDETELHNRCLRNLEDLGRALLQYPPDHSRCSAPADQWHEETTAYFPEWESGASPLRCPVDASGRAYVMDPRVSSPAMEDPSGFGNRVLLYCGKPDGTPTHRHNGGTTIVVVSVGRVTGVYETTHSTQRRVPAGVPDSGPPTPELPREAEVP